MAARSCDNVPLDVLAEVGRSAGVALTDHSDITVFRPWPRHWPFGTFSGLQEPARTRSSVLRDNLSASLLTPSRVPAVSMKEPRKVWLGNIKENFWQEKRWSGIIRLKDCISTIWVKSVKAVDLNTVRKVSWLSDMIPRPLCSSILATFHLIDFQYSQDAFDLQVSAESVRRSLPWPLIWWQRSRGLWPERGGEQSEMFRLILRVSGIFVQISETRHAILHFSSSPHPTVLQSTPRAIEWK